MDFQRLQRELTVRTAFPYDWKGTKQTNELDAATNFIYTTYSFAKLQFITKGFDELTRNYAMNRWFNFWSARGVETIFAEHNLVKPYFLQYDKLIDFSLDGIYFDHKTSVFPKGFKKNIHYAKQHTKELVEWLYANQSQQGRKHCKNRLFVVLYNKIGEHWKLKAEIELLRTAINNYLNTFKKEKLISLNIENNDIVSDIIWVEK